MSDADLDAVRVRCTALAALRTKRDRQASFWGASPFTPERIAAFEAENRRISAECDALDLNPGPNGGAGRVLADPADQSPTRNDAIRPAGLYALETDPT